MLPPIAGRECTSIVNLARGQFSEGPSYWRVNTPVESAVGAVPWTIAVRPSPLRVSTNVPCIAGKRATMVLPLISARATGRSGHFFVTRVTIFSDGSTTSLNSVSPKKDHDSMPVQVPAKRLVEVTAGDAETAGRVEFRAGLFSLTGFAVLVLTDGDFSGDDVTPGVGVGVSASSVMGAGKRWALNKRKNAARTTRTAFEVIFLIALKVERCKGPARRDTHTPRCANRHRNE